MNGIMFVNYHLYKTIHMCMLMKDIIVTNVVELFVLPISLDVTKLMFRQIE